MAVPLSAGTYVHWGVINVSVTNMAIIAVMVLVFVLAILLPFPHYEEPARHDERPNDRPDEGRRS